MGSDYYQIFVIKYITLRNVRFVCRVTFRGLSNPEEVSSC